jgi:isoleucyl-tRNA synthetase
MKFVDVQKKQFKRLGVLGHWEKPYLTLSYSYEEKIIELFGMLAEKGYVYRGLKPIHWCPNCETALAEAEIEYEDEKSHSIFVKFKVINFAEASPKFKQIKDVISKDLTSLVIWTTTPWTLPANVAVALHPDLEYALVGAGQEVFIVAEGLVEDFVKKLGIKGHKVLAKVKGKALEGTLCEHPFVKRQVMVVLDKMVTLEQGTGAVHIAPGHGDEDYKVGLKYDLPIVMPVDSRGFFTKEAGKYSGLRYNKANDSIIEDMKADGSLLHSEEMKHSYPHCWRCKKPVIFRATEQWFISVDHNGMREEALKAVAKTKWFPAWGENRIRGMVESRPDWCISRQRSWGVPIPAFYCKGCGKPHMTGKFNDAVRKLVREKGSSAWFSTPAEEILATGTKCGECGGVQFEKETDILDVWFESGSSHFAVLTGSDEFKWPADLYLEGSDQHRGWFQTSLLTAIGAKGRAPYDAVLTHGFTVDESGKKMSKSLGNVVDPQKVVNAYGADVLRLWVASADFRNDMSASDKILKQISEAYGKIRNTCRFLISNLNDFNPSSHKVSYKELKDADKWALLKLTRLVERVRRAYDEFEFHVVFHSIRDFCVNDMSSLYLDTRKDELYCAGGASAERRSAQTVLYEILRSLVLLFAPILSFTAEDIWKFVPGAEGSVFLQDIPQPEEKYIDKNLEEKWGKALEIREEVYKIIEKLRAGKDLVSALEASVELYADGKLLEVLRSVPDLPSVFIASEVKVLPISDAPEGAAVPVGEKLKVIVKKSSHAKCERCWNFRESVGKDDEHKTLCSRCAEVVKAIKGDV